MTTTSTLVLPTIPLVVQSEDNYTGVDIDRWLHFGVLLSAVSGMSGLADGTISGASYSITEYRSLVGYTRNSGELKAPVDVVLSGADVSSTTLAWPATLGTVNGDIFWSSSHHFTVKSTSNSLYTASVYFGSIDIDGGWTSCGFTLRPFFCIKTTSAALTVADAADGQSSPIVFAA